MCHLLYYISNYILNLIQIIEGSRVTREDGIGSGNDYKSTGRKKIFLLALAEKVPENYENCQQIIKKVGVNNLVDKYSFSGDLKILNILGGLMSCSSKCPCFFCQARYDKGVWEKDAPLRTARNIMENHDDWLASGGERKNAKNYKNCVKNPIIGVNPENLDTPMMFISPPPSLHLKLSVNHILTQLAELWPPCLDWLKSLHVVFSPYHGETLEGNEVNKVLNSLPSLFEILPDDLFSFYNCLKDFKDVIDSCFGFTLDENYREVISKFQSSFSQLHMEFSVTETVKIHIILTHITQFIEQEGRPLGKYSEQELENSHSAWVVIWARYKVKDFDSPTYSDHILRAVLNFNSNNI